MPELSGPGPRPWILLGSNAKARELCGAFLLAVACGGESSAPKSEPVGSVPDAGQGGASDGGAAGVNTAGDHSGGASTPGRSTGGQSAGGLASGGASSGGASSGGAAGARGGAATTGSGGSLAAPDGCELESQHSGAEYCSAELSCDGQRATISCTGQGSFWTCDCTNADTSNRFEIPDVNPQRACEVAARACVDPELLNGEETCTRQSLFDTLSCSIQDDCQTWHEIGNVRVRTKSSWKAACSECPTAGAACCRCSEQTASGAADYMLEDLDLSLGCEFLKALCELEEAPTGEQTCEFVSEMTDPNLGCQVVARCGTPIELEDGSALRLSELFTSYCVTDSGLTTCACSSEVGGRHLALAFDSDFAAIELCRTTSHACTELESLELHGSRECEQISESRTEDTCRVSYSCTQAGTVGDDELTVVASYTVTCDHPSPERFRCACRGEASGSEPVELEAGDSAAACAKALELCPAF